MKDVAWKKPKGWLESSGCEIQRWKEKGFAGFVCFGHKKVKLYIIAQILHIIVPATHRELQDTKMRHSTHFSVSNYATK